MTNITTIFPEDREIVERLVDWYERNDISGLRKFIRTIEREGKRYLKSRGKQMSNEEFRRRNMRALDNYASIADSFRNLRNTGCQDPYRAASLEGSMYFGTELDVEEPVRLFLRKVLEKRK